MNLNQQIGPYF